MDEASDSDNMAVGFHIDVVGDRQIDTDKVFFMMEIQLLCSIHE